MNDYCKKSILYIRADLRDVADKIKLLKQTNLSEASSEEIEIKLNAIATYVEHKILDVIQALIDVTDIVNKGTKEVVGCVKTDLKDMVRKIGVMKKINLSSWDESVKRRNINDYILYLEYKILGLTNGNRSTT